MYQKVILLGNLGADPELKTTQTGRQVVKINLASNKKWKDKQTGEWMESVQWHRLEAWDYLAEKIARRCKKGTTCFIEGELKTDTWEDNSGIKRWSTDVVVRVLHAVHGYIETVTQDGAWSEQKMQERGQVDAAPAEVQQLADAMTGDAKVTPGPAASTDDLPF